MTIPSDLSSLTDRGAVKVVLVTYGVLHGPPPSPEPQVCVDLSTALRNPHHDPAMRERTGLEEAVRRHVLATPGASGIVEDAVTRIRTEAARTPHVTVHVFCRGGRHRSVAVAEEVAARLRQEDDVTVDVTHRDIAEPVVTR